MAHVALTQGIKADRTTVADSAARERVCDQVEREFMKLRDRVGACSSFRKLGPGEQRRIATILFELFPPTE